MNHLVVTSDQITKIPLVELGILIIENPNMVISIHLLNALAENKTTVIICDQAHNPSITVQAIYGHHRQSKNIQQQFLWTDERKGVLWKKIIEQKINNQGKLLRYLDKNGDEDLFGFMQQVTPHDQTNREGHAAKVYFNRIFGEGFIRGNENPKNWALNYGYSIVHAIISRLIVSKGYLTELGIHHVNEYNQFNLASDFIEVFRPIIDLVVHDCIQEKFEKEEKRRLVNLLNEKIFIRNGEHFLQQAIQIYIDNCIHYLNIGDETKLVFPDLNYKKIRIQE